MNSYKFVAIPGTPCSPRFHGAEYSMERIGVNRRFLLTTVAAADPEARALFRSGWRTIRLSELVGCEVWWLRPFVASARASSSRCQ